MSAGRWWSPGLPTVALAVAVVACGSSATEPDIDPPSEDPGSRSYWMGFTDFPHRLDAQGLVDAYSVIEDDADLVALHFDDGIPWQAALDGAPYPTNWEAELAGKASLVPAGHRVYLAVTPLSSDRSGLAPNRGEEGVEPLAEPWAGRSFDHPDVIAAFTNHTLRMVDRYDPDYLAIAIEANMLLAANPESWDAFVALVSAVRQGVRERRPGLPIFVTIQAEFFHRDRATQTPALGPLLEQSDIVAVSSYPYMDRSPPSTVPADYLTAFADLAPTKPFAVSESGWPAESVGDPWPADIPSSPADQEDWVDQLLTTAESLSAEFVVWFFTRDLDVAWDEVYRDSEAAPEVRLFRDAGLLDGSGQARPGLLRWREALVLDRE